MMDFSDRVSEALPAATAVVVRQSGSGREVLLLKRSDQLKHMPGLWVFPGGKVEPTDAGEGELEQARHGAVRELEEESGIVLSPSALQPFSYWLTPTVVKRRFSTWFFLAEVSSDTVVTVDGSEIVEYQWWPAARAIDAHQTGELPMTPPTLVSLYDIHNWQGSDVLPADAVNPTPPVFFPRVVREGDTMTFLYEGDVAYDTGDLALTGPQHRTTGQGGIFSYQPSTSESQRH